MGGLLDEFGVDLVLGRAGQPLAQAECGALNELGIGTEVIDGGAYPGTY